MSFINSVRVLNSFSFQLHVGYDFTAFNLANICLPRQCQIRYRFVNGLNSTTNENDKTACLLIHADVPHSSSFFSKRKASFSEHACFLSEI